MIPPSTPNPGLSKPPRPRARNLSTSTPATKAITVCLGFFRESGLRKGRRPRSQDRSEQKSELYRYRRRRLRSRLPIHIESGCEGITPDRDYSILERLQWRSPV